MRHTDRKRLFLICCSERTDCWTLPAATSWLNFRCALLILAVAHELQVIHPEGRCELIEGHDGGIAAVLLEPAHVSLAKSAPGPSSCSKASKTSRDAGAAAASSGPAKSVTRIRQHRRGPRNRDRHQRQGPPLSRCYKPVLADPTPLHRCAPGSRCRSIPLRGSLFNPTSRIGERWRRFSRGWVGASN